MKITIHISHTESDDLSGVQAAAEALGFDVEARGGFMGKHHAEIAADLSASELEQMLSALAGRDALAA